MRRNTNHLFPALGLLASSASAQWTYPNCPAVTDADFRATPVITRALNDATILEPLKMEFAMDAEGSVDIYYIQRKGELKRYDAKAKTVTTLGTVPVETGNEDGLVGLALDPAFRTNHRVFLYYSHLSGFRLSRFTLDPATKALLPASEKVLLTVPSARGKWHTSGAMKFDAYGDLWVSLGDNETTHKGPANTADLRGGIIRIHPENDGTYSIPKGNMWEFASAHFRARGMASVADRYLDSAVMRREIYVKGTRNAYTMTLDPVRRWVAYGDCGPDQRPGNTPDRALWTEEHNVVTEPGFMGWPYWSAEQHVQEPFPYGDPAEKAAWTPLAKDPANPVNDFPGVGVPQLLPAKPATYAYAHSCAMTGPIFRYDGRLAHAGQLPPHFNRIWFTSDFNKGRITAVRLDDKGKMVGDAVEVFKGLSPNFNRPLDFQQGPDGSLYYLNYSCGTWRVSDACTGIYRIDYQGACKDPALRPENPVALARSLPRGHGLRAEPGALAVTAEGAHVLEIFGMDGRKVRHLSGVGARRYPHAVLFAGSLPGVFLARLTGDAGVSELGLPWLGHGSR